MSSKSDAGLVGCGMSRPRQSVERYSYARTNGRGASNHAIGLGVQGARSPSLRFTTYMVLSRLLLLVIAHKCSTAEAL